QVLRHGRNPPVAVAHRLRAAEERGQLARQDPLLALVARLQQLEPASAELALEAGDELERLRAEHLRGAVGDLPFYLDVPGRGHTANVALGAAQALDDRPERVEHAVGDDDVGDAEALPAPLQVLR